MDAPGDGEAHKLSDYVAKDPQRFLSVVDHVLSLGYLEPDLRQRVLRLQSQLIKAAQSTHQNGSDSGV